MKDVYGLRMSILILVFGDNNALLLRAVVTEQHTNFTVQVDDADIYKGVALLTAADSIIIPDPCRQSNSMFKCT